MLSRPILALLGLVLAVPALARDGALSLGLTAPPTALLEPGMSLGWQETLGRRLILGVGIGVSEPRPDDRDLGLVGRLSLPTDAGFNQRWYPWLGIEQPLPVNRDDIDAAQWQLGLGLERFFLPEVAGFAELRWQPELKETVHAQLGLRFWPGRLSRLDARMRDSEPVQPERSTGSFSGPIVLDNAASSEIATPNVRNPDTAQSAASASAPSPGPAQPLAMQAAPEGDPLEDADIGAPEVSESSPVQSNEPSSTTLSVDDLSPGTYVHLGLFRATESVLRLQRQLDPATRAETRVAFDAVAGGYRVVLGPYDETRATERKARLSEQGFDSFLYQRD